MKQPNDTQTADMHPDGLPAFELDHDLGLGPRVLVIGTCRDSFLSPELKAELADLELIGPGPFLVHPDVECAAIERWGRLPDNFKVVGSIPLTIQKDALCYPAVQGKQKAQWKRERSGRL